MLAIDFYVLQARGYRNFTEIGGDFRTIATTTVPKTNYVCQRKVMKA